MTSCIWAPPWLCAIWLRETPWDGVDPEGGARGLSPTGILNFAITCRKDATIFTDFWTLEFKKLLGHMGRGYQQLISFFNKDNVPWRSTKLAYVVARWWTAQKCTHNCKKKWRLILNYWYVIPEPRMDPTPITFFGPRMSKIGFCCDAAKAAK